MFAFNIWLRPPKLKLGAIPTLVAATVRDSLLTGAFVASSSEPEVDSAPDPVGV